MSKATSSSHSKHHTRKRSFFPYEIAVISTLGPETVRDQTLVLLKAYHIPADKITIWIQSPGQESAYKSVCIPGSFARIVCVPSQSESEFYNTISQSYCPGTPIVYFSDHITGIYEHSSSQTSSAKPLRSLLGLFHTAFAECKQNECMLWGVQPSHSQTVYRPTVSTSLHTLSSALWGCINPGSLLSLQLQHAVEYERCVKYYLRDEAVLRFNMIELQCLESTATNTKQFAVAAKRLLESYPNYVHIQPSKHSREFVIRLKDCSESKQSDQERQ